MKIMTSASAYSSALSLTRKLATGCVVLAALHAAAFSVQAATVTVNGSLGYTDREFDLNGFTGPEPRVPARFCRLEVVNSTDTVLNSTESDGNGVFGFSFSAAVGTVVRLRMVALSDSRDIEIQDSSTANPIWGVTVYGPVTVSSAGIWTLSLTAPIINDPTGGGRVGNPFNLLDETIKSLHLLAQLLPLGDPPTIGSTIEVRWPRTGSNSGGSYYGGFIQMGNDACDADTILHHEFGHLITDNYGSDDSPGGQHFFCGVGQNPRLSWSEGWATFWGCSVRKVSGSADPGIYVDTTGLPATNSLSFSYRIEDCTDAAGDPRCPVAQAGNDCEMAVTFSLWDLVDEIGDNPNNPSVDDDPFNGSLLPGGVEPMSAAWDVVRNYVRHPPAGTIPLAEGIVFDHFWDGWWHRGYMDTVWWAGVFAANMEPWGMTRSLYVDFRAAGPGTGTAADPYVTVTSAGAAAAPGSTLMIYPGSYDESPTINKRMHLKRDDGTGVVTLGN